MASGLLDGYTVLDFGRYIAAPFCCQILADMGAEVVRVERPGGEADRQRGPLHAGGKSLYFVTLNRNKKAITLNVDGEQGQALLKELVTKVDVLVHNLPSPRAERLGLGYAALSEANPKLVYLAVSGYGAQGPYARRVAFDAVIQAMSGAMSMTGLPGNPPTLSHVPWVDFGTALYGALAVVSALLHRERTGRGQMIDLSLYGTALSLVGAYGLPAEHVINGTIRREVGNDWIYAAGGCFAARDGHVMINAITEPMWRNLCKTIERSDLLADSRLSNDIDRYEHRAVVNHAISEWTAGRSVAEAVTMLAEAGVAVAPVQTVDRLADEPQAQALGMWDRVDQPGIGPVPVATLPLKFGETPAQIVRPAPEPGEHNAEIYGRLAGLDAERLAGLGRGGVI